MKKIDFLLQLRFPEVFWKDGQVNVLYQKKRWNFERAYIDKALICEKCNHYVRRKELVFYTMEKSPGGILCQKCLPKEHILIRGKELKKNEN